MVALTLAVRDLPARSADDVLSRMSQESLAHDLEDDVGGEALASKPPRRFPGAGPQAPAAPGHLRAVPNVFQDQAWFLAGGIVRGSP
jgi:hypothetical protein